MLETVAVFFRSQDVSDPIPSYSDFCAYLLYFGFNENTFIFQMKPAFADYKKGCSFVTPCCISLVAEHVFAYHIN